MANYKITPAKLFRHLFLVMRHRKYVRHYCFKAKLYRQGLFHDLSKYNPVEFFESVKYFTGTHSPIDECKNVNGYSKAWMHHKSHNKHHREYWTDNYDKGTTCIKMPWKYVLECFCDYLGAGRAYNSGKEDIDKELRWWKSTRSKMKINSETLCLLDCLFLLYDYRGSDFLSDKSAMKSFKRTYTSTNNCQDRLLYCVYKLLGRNSSELDFRWDKVGRNKNERYNFFSD